MTAHHYSHLSSRHSTPSAVFMLYVNVHWWYH